MQSCETTVREKKLSTSVVAGAIGGLAAAFAMNQFQALWAQTLKTVGASGPMVGGGAEVAEDATVKMAKTISSSVLRHELTVNEKKWAGPLVHYATGTILGAVYGLASAKVPAVKLGAGTAYGTAVWFGADELAIPALGLSGPPSATPIPVHLQALASHLVFGFVTNTVRRLISRI